MDTQNGTQSPTHVHSNWRLCAAGRIYALWRWYALITLALLVTHGTVCAGTLAACLHLPACICQRMDGPDDRRKRLKAMRAEAEACIVSNKEGVNGNRPSS